MIRDQDAPNLLNTLRDKEISFTKLASTGGFLREGNTTLLIGIEEKRREEVRELIKETCARREEIVESTVPLNEPIGPFVPQKIKVVRGGGILFEVPIASYERF